MKDYFWNLFKSTGNIEAYLAYKDIENISLLQREGENCESTQSQSNCY